MNRLIPHRTLAWNLGVATVSVIVVLVAMQIPESLAHKDKPHPGRADAPTAVPQGVQNTGKEVLEQIAKSYQARVEPIFRTKCLQCHGGTPELPWYYRLPGAKQIIDRDLEESKHHLDLSRGYPFVSHASPIDDLRAILETIENGSMPPLLYRLAHPDHRVTEQEVGIVKRWARDGINLLEKSAEANTSKELRSDE